jgi:uridine monophosphate synthetase
MNDLIKDIILELYQIQGVKFGSFKLKSGITSPIYVDLRVVVSFPLLVKKLSRALWEASQTLAFDILCGVPYTALPFATCLSLQHNIPMIFRRKEAKDYGTKKTIEGFYQEGQTCLVIEDVITSGSSILETTKSIREEGLIVTDSLVVIDREQGAQKNLEQAGIQAHALFTLTDLLQILKENHKISDQTFSEVSDFLKKHQG